MNPARQKAAAKAFVARWQAAEGNEDREARSFWIEFAQELLGIPNATKALNFERRVKGRKIDVFYEDMGILIENKSRGCSLDEKYVRSKKVGAETPYEQGKWYADNLPNSVRPDWIVTCNFDEIRIHNLNHVNPGSTFTSVTLEELPDMLYLFGFFTDKGNSRIEKEKQLSVKAGELVGKLYDELSKQYQNIDTDRHEQRSLNVLIVRLVFLLYAEDSGLLARRGQFYDYLKAVPVNRMRTALVELFDVLDTPEDKRDPYLDEELAAFPYINGGLFTHEDIVIPHLTDQIKVDLLAEASAGFDWKSISPTIFGAAFESTLNPETRRAGGMHYTSPENIHKVIDPLFLDDLKAELDEIEGIKIERDRVRELRIFQRKLASLTFLDPAAGSHNFLTETYISLRKLELRIIENLQGDQTSFDLIDNPIMVNIGQFYAIEITDFAVSVGKTALWIAEQQMMEKTQELLPYQRFEFLPLKSITNSVCANALRINWNEVLPSEKCSYIIGNPPFAGTKYQSSSQKDDVKNVWKDAGGKPIKTSGKTDYVASWFFKACDYIRDTSCRCAFVSTNSICQGEQVSAVWGTLLELFQVEIDFAYRPFVWSNEASNQAHVHVVIIGFSNEDKNNKKLLFSADGSAEKVDYINAYLVPAPSVVLESRRTPICDVPLMAKGSQPTDAGGLILNSEEKTDLEALFPSIAAFMKKYMGSDELINNKERWCLWLKDAPRDIIQSPYLSERLKEVADSRRRSSKEPTRRWADRPHLFTEDRQPDSKYLIVPVTSSCRRKYMPMSFCDPNTVANTTAQMVVGAGLFEFGVMMSRLHNIWIETVGGKLKSDTRYSASLVYNNFPWPDPTPKQREYIEYHAQKVLDMREQFPDKSLADLYDPDKMPQSLKDAHHELDMAVEAAYGVDFNSDEENIVAHLFKLYAEMTRS